MPKRLPDRTKTSKPKLLPGEVFQTLMVYNLPLIWMSVSNYGRLFSHRKKVGRGVGGGRGTRLEYDPNYWLESIWSREYQTRTYTDGTSRKHLTCLYKKITLPKGFFDGTLLADYDYHASSKDTFNKRITIHQAIMWTFRPWKDYPPKGIDPEVCQNLDPKLEQYLVMSSVINHKHHRPDKDNYVCLEDRSKDDLEYVTPSDNTKEAVKHYGGATYQATDHYLKELDKENEDPDNMITIGRPVPRPLFQDYSIDINFHGKEGKEMEESIRKWAKEDGLTFEEEFRKIMINGFTSDRVTATGANSLPRTIAKEVFNKEITELDYGEKEFICNTFLRFWSEEDNNEKWEVMTNGVELYKEDDTN